MDWNNLPFELDFESYSSNGSSGFRFGKWNPDLFQERVKLQKGEKECEICHDVFKVTPQRKKLCSAICRDLFFKIKVQPAGARSKKKRKKVKSICARICYKEITKARLVILKILIKNRTPKSKICQTLNISRSVCEYLFQRVKIRSKDFKYMKRYPK